MKMPHADTLETQFPESQDALPNLKIGRHTQKEKAKVCEPITNIAQDEQYNNMLSLLEARCYSRPDQRMMFYAPKGLERPPTTISYLTFLERVRSMASQLVQENIRPNSVVLIHLDNHYDNLLSWWAVTYAGFVPAMSTPLSNNMDQRRAHLTHLFSKLNDPYVLTRQRLLPDFSVQSALRLGAIETLQPSSPDTDVQQGSVKRAIKQGQLKERSDTAALMLTSGSTGNAKAVSLTHGLMLRSISGKAKALDSDARTIFFNWIAADHVACLTEIHGLAFWTGGEQIYAEAADIISDPLAFWKIMHRHQVNHSFAPNFFLASLNRALISPNGVELRKTMSHISLHTIVTGGEANVVDTGLALSTILQEAGAPPNCLKPAFGMTETSAGSIYNHVFPAHDVAQGYDFASVGKTIDGIEMRIIDDDGQEIKPGTGTIGMLQVRGEVVFREYYNDPEATESSFDDGWFNTGDQGMIDGSGQLCLTGRAKELLIINGVNYSPNSVETVLEGTDGTVPSYILVLPYREKGADTESLCVVYLPAFDPSDTEAREMTNNAISSAVLFQVGVRPFIIPLDATILQKSTLGKLPRMKIRKALESGAYESFNKTNQDAINAYRESQYEAPKNDTEQTVIDTFYQVLDMKDLKLGATTNLFAIGINSIDLIAIKKILETKLSCNNIPTVTIISSPTPRELAAALESLSATKHEYNPVVTLHAGGEKTPLWLIHPGVGEVLIFLALAYHIKDRPLYAIRARGFEVGEPHFTSIEEAVQVYYRRIKKDQPHGPYALAGYSFGSMLAFEVAKLLRKDDEVRFLGVLNLPPHIKFRMRQLDWYNCLLHLSYFLNFFSEEHAHSVHKCLQQGTKEEALHYVLSIAPPERLSQLALDEDGLGNWVDLAHGLQSAATDYEPSGLVDSMDVFYAIPLAEVAKDMDDWVDNHLSKWEDFTITKPKFHRVDGSHYTMISPAHVHTFQKVLKKALADRDV